MTDYSRENIVLQIKRFGDFLCRRLSNLFHGLDSRSVGAIAGLAVAIVFTWRLLRSPNVPQTRQPKRQNPETSNSGVANLTNPNQISSGVSSEVSSAQNVVDELFQPVKPTLGQIVRHRLSEGRKVTCRLLGVILEESTPEELQKQATVKSSVLEVLLEITKCCDLYLMERVLDDESEQVEELKNDISRNDKNLREEIKEALDSKTAVMGEMMTELRVLCLRDDDRQEEIKRNLELMKTIDVSLRTMKKVLGALEDAGIITSGGILKDKVLFCSTETGRTSFVRQLEPDWHIDTNPEIISQLSRFIRHQLYIASVKPERPTGNVLSSPSLEDFFGHI